MDSYSVDGREIRREGATGRGSNRVSSVQDGEKETKINSAIALSIATKDEEVKYPSKIMEELSHFQS